MSDAALETLTIAPRGQRDAAGRAYVLLLEGSSSSLCLLPPVGEVFIGRAPDAALRVQDPTASRRHAKIVLGGGEALLCDLGSHNGTQLNGQPVTAPRPLLSGDAITVCDVTLVFKREALAPAPRPLVNPAGLRGRLDEELARATAYQRRLALVCARFDPQVAPAAVARALAGAPRPLDTLSLPVPGELWLLLPELEPHEAMAASAQLLSALRQVASPVRLGLACCPDDGVDADDLLAGAQAAAAEAGPDQVRGAASLGVVREVGEHRVVLCDPAMRRLFDLLDRLAQSDLPVLLHGETGTGKELAAAVLHHGSRRRAGRLLTVNCAALPESLAESELFGHERGAFSGAVAMRTGVFEAASGGTLFLDELAELSPAIQAKLLRVLETGRVTRLGSTQERPVDVRIVCATHRDLDAEVGAGRFRQDLSFRLNTAVVELLPLRDRGRDLPLLCRALLLAACAQMDRAPMHISTSAMHHLLAHPWPGNIRELRNVMQFVAASAGGEELLPGHLPARLLQPAGAAHAGVAPKEAPMPAPRRFRPIEEELRELERTRMVEALAAADGVHYRAADLLGMSVRTFANRVKEYGLSRRPGLSEG